MNRVGKIYFSPAFSLEVRPSGGILARLFGRSKGGVSV